MFCLRLAIVQCSSSLTLMMIKDEEEDANLEAALTVVAKTHQERVFRNVISALQIQYVPNSLQQSPEKLSRDQQSLPSLLIGNITSAIQKQLNPGNLLAKIYQESWTPRVNF